jgi:rubrerythrin
MNQQLIDELIAANIDNLFNLDVEIFNNLTAFLTPQAYKNFKAKFLACWLADMYRREVVSSIVYEFLSKNINALNNKPQFEPIKEYLKIAASEEREHADVLYNKIIKLLGKPPSYDYNNLEYSKSVLKEYANKDPIEILIIYFIGETGLLASFKLLKKYTRDKEWNTIFQKFIVDEAGHHSTILKLLRPVIENYKEKDFLYSNPFIKEISAFMYFKSDAFQFYLLDKATSNHDLKYKIFHDAYQSDFVKIYQKDFLNKILKLAIVFDQNFDQDKLVKTLDTNILDMLKLNNLNTSVAAV